MPHKISDFCGDPGFPAKSKIWQGERGRGKFTLILVPSLRSGQASPPIKGGGCLILILRSFLGILEMFHPQISVVA